MDKTKTTVGNIVCIAVLSVLSMFAAAIGSLPVSLLLVITVFAFSFLLLRGTKYFPVTAIIEILMLFSLGISISAAVLSFVVFSAFAAVYLLRKNGVSLPRAALVTLAGLIGAAVTYFVFDSIPAAAIALIPLIAALVSSIALVKELRRTETIALISLSIILSALVIGAAWLYSENGHLSVELIRTTVDSAREQVTSYLSGLTYADLLPVEDDTVLFPEDAAELLVTLVFNVIPGVFVMGASILAFFIQKLTLVFLDVSGNESRITEESRVFTMSAVSAVVFILIAIVNFISGRVDADNAELVFTVTQNLTLILGPGFLLLGFNTLRAQAKSGAGGGIARLVWIFMIPLAFFATSALVTVLCFYGAINVVAYELREYLKTKKQQ